MTSKNETSFYQKMPSSFTKAKLNSKSLRKDLGKNNTSKDLSRDFLNLVNTNQLNSKKRNEKAKNVQGGFKTLRNFLQKLKIIDQPIEKQESSHFQQLDSKNEQNDTFLIEDHNTSKYYFDHFKLPCLIKETTKIKNLDSFYGKTKPDNIDPRINLKKIKTRYLRVLEESRSKNKLNNNIKNKNSANPIDYSLKRSVSLKKINKHVDFSFNSNTVLFETHAHKSFLPKILQKNIAVALKSNRNYNDFVHMPSYDQNLKNQKDLIKIATIALKNKRSTVYAKKHQDSNLSIYQKNNECQKSKNDFDENDFGLNLRNEKSENKNIYSKNMSKKYSNKITSEKSKYLQKNAFGEIDIDFSAHFQCNHKKLISKFQIDINNQGFKSLNQKNENEKKSSRNKNLKQLLSEENEKTIDLQNQPPNFEEQSKFDFNQINSKAFTSYMSIIEMLLEMKCITNKTQLTRTRPPVDIGNLNLKNQIEEPCYFLIKNLVIKYYRDVKAKKRNFLF